MRRHLSTVGCFLLLISSPAFAAPHTLIPNLTAQPSSLRLRLAQLQSRRQELLYEFKETAPQIRKISGQIKDLRARLSQSQQPRRWSPNPEAHPKAVPSRFSDCYNPNHREPAPANGSRD